MFPASQLHGHCTEGPEAVSCDANCTSAVAGARHRFMDEPESCQESQDLDDLARSPQNRRIFPDVAGFCSKGRWSVASPERMKLLRAWYTFATVFAVFVACVSITNSIRSHAQLVWALAAVVEVEASEKRSLDPSSESTTAQRSHFQQSPHGYQAHEAESDNHDDDCEATAVRTHRILGIPALRERQVAPKSGWLMTPADLCVSSTFPRGPPTAS